MFMGIVIIVSSQLSAQSRVVYGKLTAFNKYPLQNIEVIAKKSKAAVKTDSLGMFSIVCAKKDVIKIKPKAFQPVTRRIDPDTDTLKINLIFIDTENNRAVATGYGYIDHKDLNFAVSHLEQENSEFCNYSDIFELLAGRFPGVTVDQSQSDGAIFIRGSSSINLSNEALYVVDEVVVSSLGWIHPCEVRTINVIKDGLAAIYGSRGANGVVVIETKGGGN